MGKQYKVKRYKKIYRRNRTSVWKIILIVLLIAGLFFLGWSLYEPISEFLSRAFSSDPAKEQSEISSLPEDSSISEASENESSEEQIIPTGSNHAVYLPFTTVSDSRKLAEFLSSLDRTKVNAVVFELKDDEGLVLYQSQVAEAIRAKVITAEAFDLRTVTDQIREAGFMPIGKMSAFKDHLLPKVIWDASVKYLDTGILWLDNSKELGGRLWLNPYSETAQNYIINLALEAADLGIEELIVDRIHFPLGVGQDVANYGPNQNTMSKQQVLTKFTAKLQEKLKEKNVKLTQMFTASDLLLDWTIGYQGAPLLMAPDSVIVNLCPSQFGEWFEYNGKFLQKAGSKPEETIIQVMEDLKALDWKGREMTVMVQAYNDALSSTVYDAAVVEKELQALIGQGAERFVVYHPDGAYDMAALESFAQHPSK